MLGDPLTNDGGNGLRVFEHERMLVVEQEVVLGVRVQRFEVLLDDAGNAVGLDLPCGHGTCCGVAQ